MTEIEAKMFFNELPNKLREKGIRECTIEIIEKIEKTFDVEYWEGNIDWFLERDFDEASYEAVCLTTEVAGNYCGEKIAWIEAEQIVKSAVAIIRSELQAFND